MPSIKELEGWLTTKQAAERLGRSRQGTINLAEDGRVRAVKVGGEVWAYDPQSVEELASRERPKDRELLIEKAGTMLRVCWSQLGQGKTGIDSPYTTIIAEAIALFANDGPSRDDAVSFVIDRWDEIEEAARMHPGLPEHRREG